MKLIRLSTDDPKLYFNNTIQSDLTLPPQSKIGLLNCNFEKQLNSLVVNHTNDQVSFYLIDTEYTSGSFTHDTYSEENIDVLLKSMKVELNNALTINNGKALGSKFDVRINSSNKVVIETTQSELVDPMSEIGLGKTTYNKQDLAQDVNKIITKNGGTDGDPDAFVGTEFKDFFESGEGCGVWRVKLEGQNGGTSGFHISMNDQPVGDMLARGFNDDEIDFGIYADLGSGNVYRWKNGDGTVNNTSITVDWDNDGIEISMNKGKLEGRVYQVGDVTHLLFSEILDPALGLSYFPALIVEGNNIALSRLKYSPKISDEEEQNENSLAMVGGALAVTVPSQTFGAVDTSIRFKNISLANFLGYDSVLYPIDGSKKKKAEIEFIADNKIQFVDQSEAYIVELLNLNIDSFDGIKSQEKRKNILMLIQNGRERTQSDVLFEANNTIFIDLNNAYPIAVRNLQLRIVDDNYNDVEARGRANITLLVD